MWYAIRASFIIMFIEAADVFINNHMKLTAFRALNFGRFCEQLLHKLYDMYVEFNESMKVFPFRS